MMKSSMTGFDIAHLWQRYFPSLDFEEYSDIDFSLVKKVLAPDFGGGRYFYDRGWHYYSSNVLALKPIGIVEPSIKSIEGSFAYFHINMRIASLSAEGMISLHNWALDNGRFYPVFIWRHSMGKDRIEPYFLCPKETDGVLLQAAMNA